MVARHFFTRVVPKVGSHSAVYPIADVLDRRNGIDHMPSSYGDLIHAQSRPRLNGNQLLYYGRVHYEHTVMHKQFLTSSSLKLLIIYLA